MSAKGAALAESTNGKVRKAPAKRTASVLCEKQEESPEQPSKAKVKHQIAKNQGGHAAAAVGKGLQTVSQGLPAPAVKPLVHTSMPKESAHANAFGLQDAPPQERAATSEPASASAQQPAAPAPQQNSAAMDPPLLGDRLAARNNLSQKRAGLPLDSSAPAGAPAPASAPIAAVCAHQAGTSAAVRPPDLLQPQAPLAWQAKALAAADQRAAQSGAAHAAASRPHAKHANSSAAAAAPQAGLPIILPLMHP